MVEFSLPHLDISARREANRYKAHRQKRGGGSAPRIREEHGAMLLSQLRAAFQDVTESPPLDESFERSEGSYYQVELRKGSDAEGLDRKRDGIYSGATKRSVDADSLTTVLFVPDESVAVLEQILEDYRAGPLSEKGNPPKQGYVEPIEAIRRARLFSFWTDKPDALPGDPQAGIWWEVWCIRDLEGGVIDTLRQLECQIAAEDY